MIVGNEGRAEHELLVARVDVAVAAAARGQRDRRLIVRAEIAPAVAAEQRQGRRQLQVDLAAGLVSVVGEVLRDRIIVRRARDVRRRQSAEHLPRERRHRDRRSGRIDDARPRIANVDGEDAGVLRRRGQRREHCGLPVLTEALEVGEEERLVLRDGTAEDAAILIAPQRRLLAVGRQEVRKRVQRRVAEELEDVAAQAVAAAPIGDVHRRAGRASVLGALIVGDEAELRHRVGRRLHHLVREPLVARAVGVVVDAVDQEVVERAAEAVDVERAFARRAVGALVERGLPDAGREQRERRVLAAVERELAHLVAGNHLPALARVGLEERRLRRHGDALGDLPDRQREVDAPPRGHLHFHVVHERDGEAGLLRGDDVDAGADGDELEPAVSAGDLGLRNAGRGVRQRDLRVGHGGAGRVADGADDGCGFELSSGRGHEWARENQQE